ncbi:Dabb family protein [Marinoscillum furvescens]|uniref:Stress responsive alpha/beta barrel protein n=1 Tax=Marinoscillum furvescens DSM 4134 TaxID=1122208 RepID=A0A3D9KZV5_MARFU|nr:Dabb family protein [Marinoscillum furvescens]RED95954.1 stress responsive alpha/beta barrel protein [Marinoscillum furvescens DSM 4134]
MKSNQAIFLSLIFTCILLFSCEADNSEPKEVLRHVVAFTFKDSITTERQQQAITDFKALKNQIPGILSFEGGEDVSVEGFTKNLTHCFIITFEDQAARDAYIPHSAHLELVKKNKPLMNDLLVLDFWGKD